MSGGRKFNSGFVGLVGRPNVGKSTLLNCLVGQKVAIMSDKPQTTRHKIVGVFSFPEGQIVFIDTPGLHKPRQKLGDYMVATAKRTLNEVDIVLHITDVSVPWSTGEEWVLGELNKVSSPVIAVLNKVDLVAAEVVAERSSLLVARLDWAGVFPVSGLTGEGVPRLAEKLIALLPEGPPYYPEDMVTDQPERVILAELIREKALMLTRDEVPHSLMVQVEVVEKMENGVLRVEATIYVERESQKGIVIGRGGLMLKEIGSMAREEIEALLGDQVFLNLWVKVKDSWRKRENVLRNFGFTMDIY